MKKSRIIVLFRNDFRLHDNPALYEASRTGEIIPVYIHESTNHTKSMGGAQKWWLHQCLLSFQTSLENMNGRLYLFNGNAEVLLPEIIETTEADAVYWNRCYDPKTYRRDLKIAALLIEENIQIKSFEGRLLRPPWEVVKEEKVPYRVFSAFYKAFLKEEVPKPFPALKESVFAETDLKGETISSLGLLPKMNWTKTMEETWMPGENHAIEQFKDFCETKLARYHEARDIPFPEGFSVMSPYLALGIMSVRSMYHYLKNNPHSSAYIRQLIWRDYAYQLLFHFPDLHGISLDERFTSFEWRIDEADFDAWKHGRTGFPIVDAGMRELWATGYLPNRVRMIAASFLVKDLLIPWQKGEEWFWDTLIDADIANNSMGWQWVAGTGIDPAPYFRIFNPVLQSEKFDKDGRYIKKWVPELKSLPAKYIHDPSKAPDHVLQEAGIELGTDYPFPIVDHKAARKRALEHYGQIKKG
ncbi:cryptochrome/photolyase family protein [Falsibacillus pallidus]|uniref:Deoxyribodipyrimidine photo-lyase n=1 Tax=Falsibacillus pallidus TaxID=493781 RepID=A0A370H1J2_9BACI|nr:deoxyribodipyrimidine photo-lyase [Falsibacillus pallidus]RDI47913.1 deoxyribodipyrimidine photo-lyase type I [Falsibacillus pallidus]